MLFFVSIQLDKKEVLLMFIFGDLIGNFIDFLLNPIGAIASFFRILFRFWL